MIKLIIQVADIHIRNVLRHDEYAQQLGKFIEKVKEIASPYKKEEVRIALATLINEEFSELGEIDMEKDIVTEYGINSVSIIRLIVSAEEKFGIQFSDYELSLEEYPTFGDLAAVIKDKLDKKED